MRSVLRIVADILSVTTLTFLTSPLSSQVATYPPRKPSPPKIEPQIFLLHESVVQRQWPNTLNLINAPKSITVLNPGQCVRVGIISTGDDRDEFLRATRVSFTAQFGGKKDDYSSVPPSNFKQVKPEGGDFVAAALGAVGIKQPEEIKTMASLAVSPERWCIPDNSGDGIATMNAEVDAPDGRHSLNRLTVQVQSFESGSKEAFKDAEELSKFLQTYYEQPNPARLLPALQFLVADQRQNPRAGQAEIFGAFLTAAIKSDPTAAKDFRMRVLTQVPMIRAFGLLAVRAAGYDIQAELAAMSVEERQKFLKLPLLQDPFDLTPTQELFQHLDMMWAVFGATGQIEPVKTIASTLSWRADYDDFLKMRNTPNHPSTLTPSIVRAVVYSAAGWSLGSFQRNDPLVADYIEYLLASPETPASVKSELAGLSSNPAFKKPGA